MKATTDFPPSMPGDIMTLKTVEISLRNLQRRPLFGGTREEYPSQEAIRAAYQRVHEVYGKRVQLVTPKLSLEGILQPAPTLLGVRFVHYEGKTPSSHIYSPEDVQVEQREGKYVITPDTIGGCSPLYGPAGLKAKYALWRVGIRPHPTP